MLKTTPAVFAVGNNYQIMVPVTKQSLFWVCISGKKYCDEINGIMRTNCKVHRVTVPADVLDKAGKYTVCEKEIIVRKSYYTESGKIEETEYNFYHIPNDNIRVYHIADSHNLIDEPVLSAEKFGDIDLLVLNGDIQNDSSSLENYDVIYEIIDRITSGNKPVVFARGNHDLRGFFAEQMTDYIPNDLGNTYYSFQVGPIWGLVLDCGEDKRDNNEEYGGTICCNDFRKRQVGFIKSIIENKKMEYEKEDVKYKIIISHNPFSILKRFPFDVQSDVYSQWGSLIKEKIKPDIMISGHLHEAFLSTMGSKYDNLNQPCTLVVGSSVNTNEKYYLGCGLVFKQNKITSVFCDSNGVISEKSEIII